MAVRTQQMGVNLETEVARSHTLTFRGVNTRARSTRPNQGERSSLRNLFRRLGHRANLRYTLNRRHDQERFQQLAA